MKFNITQPCDNCPFRSDVHPYLSKKRVEGIAKGLVYGSETFACHKTTSGGNGRMTRKQTAQSSHCAGALIIQHKTGKVGQMAQIAERLGLFDPSKLKMNSPVYETFEAMALAQR